MGQLNNARLKAIDLQITSLQVEMQKLHDKSDETRDAEIGRKISELLAEKHRIERSEGSEGMGK